MERKVIREKRVIMTKAFILLNSIKTINCFSKKGNIHSDPIITANLQFILLSSMGHGEEIAI
jgi:hypothetical protein